ncbi:MAG: RNA polymerase sigma factor RpoH [Betaproteobacteria bacterium]|nr:MAG: RNA polymerase sigma factor RpoH [Betaproteobacteria bacterium]
MTRTMTLPVPVGSLETYIQAVNRFPILSLEEERDLARKFRSDNDVEAARQLVLSHLRLVVAIARGYMGYGLPQGDLIQEGNIGLMKAVKRFDPERGVRLVSFAVHWIRAEIHEFVLRNWRMVKVATTKAQRKLFFNLRSMKPSLGPMTQSEIGSMATELRVKPEEVAEMEMRLAGQEISLEPASDEDEPYAPIAYLADRSPGPSEIVETKQDETLRAHGLETALASLDARSRRIIEARWLREKDSATLHELAAEFKVSAERIRQIEAKALAKMKDVIAAA